MRYRAPAGLPSRPASRSPTQQQIPLQLTPALFFICPEGVFVVPTPVPGKG